MALISRASMPALQPHFRGIDPRISSSDVLRAVASRASSDHEIVERQRESEHPPAGDDTPARSKRQRHCEEGAPKRMQQPRSSAASSRLRSSSAEPRLHHDAAGSFSVEGVSVRDGDGPEAALGVNSDEQQQDSDRPGKMTSGITRRRIEHAREQRAGPQNVRRARARRPPTCRAASRQWPTTPPNREAHPGRVDHVARSLKNSRHVPAQRPAAPRRPPAAEPLNE